MFPDMTRYWNAFFMLHASRREGFNGASALAVTDISAFLAIRGVEDIDAKARYYEVILALDVTFLRWIREEKQNQEENGISSDSSKS